MKKVDLDKEFEKWKQENEEHLKEHFLDTHDFQGYLEEAWQRYQRENDLYDISNDLCEVSNEIKEEDLI